MLQGQVTVGGTRPPDELGKGVGCVLGQGGRAWDRRRFSLGTLGPTSSGLDGGQEPPC
jgi:hypothetical protein